MNSSSSKSSKSWFESICKLKEKVGPKACTDVQSMKLEEPFLFWRLQSFLTARFFFTKTNSYVTRYFFLVLQIALLQNKQPPFEKICTDLRKFFFSPCSGVFFSTGQWDLFFFNVFVQDLQCESDTSVKTKTNCKMYKLP